MSPKNRKRPVQPAPPPPRAKVVDTSDLLAGQWTIPIILALVHLTIALFAFHAAPFTGGDDATYISLARSLIQGHGYTDIWDPSARPETVYPPIFPVIVAGGLLSGLSVSVGLKLMMVAISSGAVFLSCVWLRRETTPYVALAAGLLLAISPEIIEEGREVLSDATFWLFSIGAVLAWRRYALLSADSRKEAVAWPGMSAAIASALTVAAYFTRSAGLPLLIAALLWLGIRKDRKSIAILLAMAVPLIVAWWLRARDSASASYISSFMLVNPYVPAKGTIGLHDAFARVARNFFQYRRYHVPRVFGIASESLILGTILIGLAVAGWAERTRRPGLAEMWTVAYVGLVLLWPVEWAAPRFLLPLIPVLCLYLSEGVAAAASFTPRPKVAGAIILATAVTMILPNVRKEIEAGAKCRADYEAGDEFPCISSNMRDFFVAASSARNRLPAGSVVLTRKPTVFFLYSGYRSVLYPLSPDADSLFKAARLNRAQFLLIDKLSDLSPMYLVPVLRARNEDFCIMSELSQPNVLFARIEPGAFPAPPGSKPHTLGRCPPAALPSA